MGLPNSSGIPPAAADAIAQYVDVAQKYDPADARYLMNHRGHLMFVKPEERAYVTAELIRDTSFTATEAELIQRVGALRDRIVQPDPFRIDPVPPRRKGSGHAVRLAEQLADLVGLSIGKRHREVLTADLPRGIPQQIEPPELRAHKPKVEPCKQQQRRKASGQGCQDDPPF